MTHEELTDRLLSTKLSLPHKTPGHKTLQKHHSAKKPEISKDGLPESVSWKDANVYTNKNIDQGSCGSCWAFTTATTMEALYSITNKIEKNPPSFSV